MPIISGMRVIGKVYGDLTGSLFEPQVKSIANVATGTLNVANGGTGTGSLASGGVLLGNGTGSLTVVTGTADGHVLTWSGATSTWISATASAGGGGGSGDITGVTAGTNLNGGGSSGEVTLNLNDTITLSTVTASVGLSASLIRFPDGTSLTSSTGLSGGGLSTVYTVGNIINSGSSGDPVTLKSNIVLTSVTASLFGNATTADSATVAGFATNAETASYVTTANYATAAGFATNAETASLALSTDFATVSGLALSSVYSLQGTANQVLVNDTSGATITGSVTLTLPQNIGTTNSPQFSSIKVNSLTHGLDSVSIAAAPIAGIPAVNAVRLISGSVNGTYYTGDYVSIGSSGSLSGIKINAASQILLHASVVNITGAITGSTGINVPNATITTGSLTLGSVGTLLVQDSVNILTGSNKPSDIVTLNGGDPSGVAINNLLVTPNSVILLTKQTANFPSGSLSIGTKSSGFFNITSSAAGDTDSVAYFIIKS